MVTKTRVANDKGGGGGGKRIERGKGWCWEMCRNIFKNYIQLAFGREGGGGAGRHVERTKITPPTCVWVRGR